MKYAVTVLFDASRGITVEADSPEEAEQKAVDEVGSATLCNQCSHEVEMGDALGAHVYEDEGNGPQVLNTTYHAQRIATLEAEVARRAAELAQLRHCMASPAPGMAVQALAGEIVDALVADRDEGYDLEAGLFGTAFSTLVRRWAAAEYALQGIAK